MLSRLYKQIKRVLWRSLLSRGQFNVRLDSGLMLAIRSQSDFLALNEIFIRRDYDPAIEAALQFDAERFVVVDCGANSGLFSLRFVDRLFSKSNSTKVQLYAVEGVPYLLEQYHVRMATVRSPRLMVNAIHGLIGKAYGEGSISIARSDLTGSVIGGTSDTDVISRVPYINLSELCRVESVIHLLKLDIEGSEFEFLKENRAILERVRVICCEFHRPCGDPHDAIRHIESLGFITTILKDHPLYPLVLFTRAA